MIFLFVLFCYLLMVTWAGDHLTFALYFGDNVLVDSGKGITFMKGQIAATEDENVYMVWVDNDAIYFNSAQSNGTKFGSPIVLSNNNTISSSPQIAASENGTVDVVWVDRNSTSGHSDVMFRASNNYGVNFDRSVHIDMNTNLTSTSYSSTTSAPQIVTTENGYVYVVWVDKNNVTGDSNLIFRSSNDSGENFSDRKELGGTDVLPFSPQIAATENGNVYIAWIDIDSTTGDSNVVFRSSNDSGENFSSKKQIRGGKDFSRSPQIAATEKGNVYIAWVDIDSTTGDSNILFRSSNDSGENFADRKHLRTGKVLSYSPQIAATEKGNVHLVWIDKNITTGDSNIVFRSSINNGENFKSRIHLNQYPSQLSNSFSPQIAATEKGKVYVVWIEDHVKFKEILHNDYLFGETISLSNSTSTSSPQIAATENGNVYVVWIDKNGTGSEESLLFKRISEFFFDRNS